MASMVEAEKERRAIVPHGAYEEESSFQIVQHRYTGAGYPGYGCYIEVLEVKDPPFNKKRTGIILHEYSSYPEGDRSYFAEFDTVPQALKAFDYATRSSYPYLRNIRFPRGLAAKRRVNCGRCTPWFYAKKNDQIVSDFAFSASLTKEEIKEILI